MSQKKKKIILGNDTWLLTHVIIKPGVSFMQGFPTQMKKERNKIISEKL
jgi:hypothetical protein